MEVTREGLLGEISRTPKKKKKQTNRFWNSHYRVSMTCDNCDKTSCLGHFKPN